MKIKKLVKSLNKWIRMMGILENFDNTFSNNLCCKRNHDDDLCLNPMLYNI